jgi:8-oxo-dGTP pyrophosphatase MutT (NUDIX family)
MAKVRAAGVFLVRRDRKILVGHPTNHKPSFWSIPKGKVDEGETTLEAAIRETYEECNVKLFKDLHHFIDLGTHVYRHKKKEVTLYAHLETEQSKWDKFQIRCNSNVPEERGGFPEFDNFEWVTFEEAKKILHSTQVEGLKVLEKKLS